MIISLPLIRLILKSLVASPLQASLTRPWLASLFRQRLKPTKGMEICFNPGPSKVTLMLQWRCASGLGQARGERERECVRERKERERDSFSKFNHFKFSRWQVSRASPALRMTLSGRYLNNLDGLGYIIMPWQFGHTCQSTIWQPACQCGEAYRGKDKRHTVPAFTRLHCALLGADLGKFAIQNNFLKRIFFRLMNTEFGRQGFKLHIATTGEHFVASLPHGYVKI